MIARLIANPLFYLLGALGNQQLTDDAQFHYRSYTDGKVGDALRQHIQQAIGQHTNKGKTCNKTDNLSTGSWELKIGVQKNSKTKVDDWKVLDLLKDVLNLPLKANKRHLTIAIEHVEFWDETELWLSELLTYIKKHGIGEDISRHVGHR